MKEPIATEQIFNGIGQRIGLKYHYADGSSREILERRTAEEVSSTLERIIKKCNDKKCR